MRMRRFTWRDQEVLLTGLGPTVVAPGQQKQPMGFRIQPGTLYLGFEVARRLNLRPGDTPDAAAQSRATDYHRSNGVQRHRRANLCIP